MAALAALPAEQVVRVGPQVLLGPPPITPVVALWPAAAAAVAVRAMPALAETHPPVPEGRVARVRCLPAVRAEALLLVAAATLASCLAVADPGHIGPAVLRLEAAPVVGVQ